MVLYENLKRLIIGKISILIAENSLDYSSDYKDEMMELDNLKDILEFGNGAWIGVHWNLGTPSPIPALFEGGEWLKQYSRTLADTLIEKETQLKNINQSLNEKESKVNYFRDELVKQEAVVNSLKNECVSLTNKEKRLKLDMNDLVTSLSREIDKNKENFSNYSAVREELEKAKVKIKKREENSVNLTPEKDILELKEKNKIIENLLVEERLSFRQKSMIGVAGMSLLIGFLIIKCIKCCKKKKKKKNREVWPSGWRR